MAEDTLHTFLSLWEYQHHTTPHATAVVGRDATLTYATLNAEAERLAAYLHTLHVVWETPIALYFDRDDHHAVVALLAVLKVGAAYLPLDPTHPTERVGYMLADAQVPIVLTTHSRAATLPPFQGKTIAVEAPVPPYEWHPVPVFPSQLAYMLYTSGSTGMPKGVMVTHGGLANYLVWARETYGMDAGYGAPVHSPLTFDLTVTSLLLPLVAGKTAHLLPDAPGAEALRDALLERDDWSLVKLTPAHLDLLRATIPLERLATRRHTFVIGGEALTTAQTAPWREACPTIRLINEYGPTETVVGCSIYEVTDDEPTNSLPIGTPIANTHLYILNAQLQPVPTGEIGELYIGGAGVARGYLHRPALTAERFVPNPFGDAGSRLYKSGDLARLRPDGQFEFHGRADSQVKIRGYRIEPGEIEAALRRHPSVRDAVVTAPEFPTGKQLVAYIVPRNDRLSIDEVRVYIEETLPAYMVPQVIMSVAQLPLTPNGKVDRVQLPAPHMVATRHVLPDTPIERLLFDTWAAVLGHTDFDVTSDFFTVGGQSLAAVQVLARLRDQLELDIPLLTFFRHPTLRAFAGVVETLLFAAVEASDLVDVDQPSPFGA